MLRRLFCCALLVMLPGAVAALSADWEAQLQTRLDNPVGDDAAALGDLMDLYWHWQLDVYPELASSYGEPGDYGASERDSRWMTTCCCAIWK